MEINRTWVSNVVGWSRSAIDVSPRSRALVWAGGLIYWQEIARYHLDGHTCLGVEDVSRQAFGGPILTSNDNWCESATWNYTYTFKAEADSRLAPDAQLVCGKESPSLVFCAPNLFSNGRVFTHDRSCRQVPAALGLQSSYWQATGTLITNFLGPQQHAQEMSGLYMERVLENHSLGRQALGCIWILFFAILRTTAEQIGFAFEIFDPINSSSSVRQWWRKDERRPCWCFGHSYRLYLNWMTYPPSWKTRTDSRVSTGTFPAWRNSWAFSFLCGCTSLQMMAQVLESILPHFAHRTTRWQLTSNLQGLKQRYNKSKSFVGRTCVNTMH